MTSHGLCWQCGQTTGRYDVEQRRWACRTCSPKRLPGDYRLHDAPDQIQDALDAMSASEPVAPALPRLPGESRQAHRRRCREAQGGA